MMIGRRLNNTSTMLFVVVITILAIDTDTVEARLRGGAPGSVRKPTMPKATAVSSSSSVQSRRAEEEKDNDLLMKLEKEYHLEEESRKEAMEHAMAMHNHVMLNEDALAEMNELVSSLNEEERQHQLRAKEEDNEKKERMESLVVENNDMEKLLRKEKEEYQKYKNELVEIKTRDQKRNQKLIRDADEETKKQQELKDATDSYMHEHMHGNDENSVIVDEQNIQNLHNEEMKLQEEYHKNKMEEEQKLQDEYLRRMELEQATTLDLL